MSNAQKHELEQKQARVTFLKKFIAENTPLAFHDLDAGFFMSAAARLKCLAAYAEEMSGLLNAIMQLEFALEREQASQTYLFAGVAPSIS
ncbi:MAG TPA: hypothetical protein VK968_07710 [Roseimicrobium sp.]|nr:hypothetical protein [Roseimicrobium sp.]